MKNFKLYFLAAIAAISLTSCMKGDDFNNDMYFPDAIVTVKPTSDKDFYLQLDDKTALLPVGISKLPFGNKEVRALVNYTKVDLPADADKEKFAGAVKINWMDSILTKKTTPTKGAENDKVFGNDPVEMLRSWMTVVEDGYITLHFTTIWGNTNIRHEVNMLTGTNPDNPYEIEFRHNAHGDCCGYQQDGVVAFSLSDLPDTEGKTVKLKVKWKSFSGPKSVEFDYCTRN